MKHKDAVLITTIYHPKPGYEDQFVKIWNDKVAALAYKMGATMVGIYHNENTEEYLGSSHWPTALQAEKFIDSPALKSATEATNHLCLVPASREVFEILREAAA